MKQLRIDFAPPGAARTLHRAGAAGQALALAALAACVCAGWLGWQVRAHQRAYAAQLAAVPASAPKPAPASAPPPIPDEQARAINAAILQLNLPWGRLHGAIDSATPPGIALLALEPDAHKRMVRITAEARNADDMVGYVEQLSASEFFSGAVLTRHEINEQDPNRPIRFQIEAAWSAR
jgi:hypothetical protein